MIDQATASILSDRAYQNLTTGQVFGPSNRYTVLDTTGENLPSGYFGAIVFDTETNTNYLVSRGTQPTPSDFPPDLAADIDIVFGGPGGNQYEDAKSFLNEYNSKPDSIPVTAATGHSLGGLLSQAVGIINNLDVVTFGSPGGQRILNDLIADGHAVIVEDYKYSEKMFNIIAEGDPVGEFGQHIVGSNVQFINTEDLVDQTLFGRIASSYAQVATLIGLDDIKVYDLAGSAFTALTVAGAKVVYHNMDNYRTIVAGDFVPTVASSNLLTFASTDNGDTISFFGDILRVDNESGANTIFYEHTDGNLYGLTTSADGTSTFYHKDQNGDLVLKPFNGLSDMSNLTLQEQHLAQEILYQEVRAYQEAAKTLYQENPDFINQPGFSDLPPKMQEIIAEMVVDGEWLIQDELQEGQTLDLNETITRTLHSDGGVYPLIATTLGRGAEQLSVDTLVHIIRNGNKDDQIKASWDLYSQVLANGTIQTGTGDLVLEDITVRRIANNYGGQAIEVSHAGKAVNVITKYEDNFQQNVLEVIDLSGRTVSAQITVIDHGIGKVFGGEPIKITYPEDQTFEIAGGYVAGIIGQKFANGNEYHDLVYSAAIKTLTQNTGQFLDLLGTGQNSVLESIFDPLFGLDGTNAQRADIFDDLSKNLQLGVVSLVSNTILEELGDTVEIGGIGGEIFNVVAGQITTGLVQGALVQGGLNVIFDNLDGGAYANLLSSGFDFAEPIFDARFVDPDFIGPIDPNVPNTTVGDVIELQVVNALAAYAGGRLAGELIEPESQTAAVFGSIGSGLATAVVSGSISAGQTLTSILSLGAGGGPVGIAIAAFIGTLAGTSLGNAFGGQDNPSAVSHVDFEPSDGTYRVEFTYTNDGGPSEISSSIADSIVQGVNSIIEATGGALRHTAAAPEFMVGWKQGTYFVNVIDGEYREFGSASDAVAFATLHTLKNFDLVGGHAILMRAWHNTEAQTLQEWQADIQVAEAFQAYLANPTGILALMMDQPDSEAAQAWAAILQRATELELHLPHEKDIDGGWNELLLARGITDPSLLPDIEGDSIVLTDPVTGEETILHHVIGPGYEIVRIEGTDGNDIIEVIVDGPSITHVDAGPGDDTVIGSDERDIILGGDGDDTIEGRDGDDWINGGAGNDTINGNGGLDLIYGGDDDDTLFGDEDGDAMYGGFGNDWLEGLAGDDELFGGHGNDTLYGGSGVDLLMGQEGDDLLVGNGDGDTLIGGAGNDTYDTSVGNNTVLISRGDGHDVIRGSAENYTRIEFDYNISPNELWFERVENTDDLLISVLGENQSVLIKDIISDNASGHRFVFESLGLIDLSGKGSRHTNDDNGEWSYLWYEAQINMNQTANGNWQGPIGEYNVMSDADLIQKQNDAETWLSMGDTNGRIADPYSGSYHTWEIKPQVHNRLAFGGAESENFYVSAYSRGEHYSGDFIMGGAGNDTIIAPDDQSYGTYDFLYGDSGDDYIDGGYGWDTIVGGLGNDTLRGDRGEDEVYGGHGDDSIWGQRGNDTLYGGAGNDTIYGGERHDTLYGGDGDDTLIDDDGNNAIYGEDGNDVIVINTTIGVVGDNLIDGGAGDDIITASDGNDVIQGGYGTDIVRGSGGDDIIEGNAGEDSIYGGAGDDLAMGGDGNDHVYGEAGQDKLYGGVGDDILEGGSGDDEIYGGVGYDIAKFSADESNYSIIKQEDDKVLVTGTDGSDILSGIEVLRFGSNHDLLVSDINIAPEAVNDDVNTDEDTPITFDVLSNDRDRDNETFTVTALTTALYGLVVLNQDGTITYTPDENFNGSDTVSYTITDARGATGQGNFLITVNSLNDAPDAVDDVVDIQKDTGITLSPLVNDSDVEDDELSIVSINGAQNGTATLNQDSTISYHAAPNFVGTDLITYIVTDGNGGESEATITITVSDVNQAPIVINSSAGLEENTVLTITAAMLSITDADNDPAAIVLTINSVPSSGVLALNGNAINIGDIITMQDILDLAVTFTPDTNQSGAFVFNYSVSDGENVLSNQAFSLTVSEVNDAPIASGDAAYLNQDASINIDVLANDNDADDEFLTVLSVGEALHGIVSLNADKTIKYSPNPGYHGSDSFTYIVSDPSGLTSLANVSVTIAEQTGINGTSGADRFNGGNSVDVYKGLGGNDRIFGYGGDDKLYGDEGNDIIHGKQGNDIIYGGAGNDVLDGNAGDDFMSGGDGNDKIRGNDHSDTIHGGSGADNISGNTGNDLLYGGDGDDKLYGNADNDILYGGNGNDFLDGTAGNDILYGGAGSDVLQGETGADTFAFESDTAFQGVDTIKDFKINQGDKIDISDLLSSYDPIADALSDFVQITRSGSNSILSVDQNGGGDSFQIVGQLSNQTNLDLETLINSGSLIV